MYKIIEETAAEMGLPFEIGTYAKLNIILDKARREQRLPACVQVESTQGTLTFGTGAYDQDAIKSESVNVGFVESMTINEPPRNAVDKADKLVGYGMQLIKRLKNKGWQVGNASWTTMYDRFDATLIFVVFSFTLTPENAICFDNI